MLILVQLFHLAVTLYMFTCLFYMIYCHVYGKQTRWLAIAYLSVLVETVVFFVYGWVCPLRVWVSSQYSPDTADILLPSTLSQHITEAGIGLLAIAILTKIYPFKSRPAR
ncbi:hypothetical protein IQ254_07630 [Nodosilinea sp. LEGE 07088]|uniref:hypothetical protein n=1 Tax=Nodosilinea sp. LEGE 07088 TaxID=2777968 RepID=UPI00188259DF|nr:hypothetical protein [Nodosilinea sp. LEGE 07088]MBE9137072.1 hypothetical protein [Nodosilinea sp. LEGE 07088]